MSRIGANPPAVDRVIAALDFGSGLDCSTTSTNEDYAVPDNPRLPVIPFKALEARRTRQGWPVLLVLEH